MPTALASPAERRRDARRQACARSCLARLELEGPPGARLEALARDAGLTKQTLLFYFADKADLWAEAVACAWEDVLRALGRQVAGEPGAAAVRALRRGLDELSRILPHALAVVLDSQGSAPRSSTRHQERVAAVYRPLEDSLGRALGGARGDPEDARALGRLALLTLLALHREARAQERSGLFGRPRLAADLDLAEERLVALARARRRR